VNTPTTSSSSMSVSSMAPCLRVAEGDAVRDFAWYPLMRSDVPQTCCFFASARDHPVHLWDAYDGSLRATYVAKNSLDQIAPAASVAASPCGSRLFCGFDRMVRVFDVGRPGIACEERPTIRSRRSREGQRGLISTIAFSGLGVYAAGSYNGSIGLYGEAGGERAAIINVPSGPSGRAHVHAAGVTQVLFSPCGRLLYSGGRKDNQIIVWDLRVLGGDSAGDVQRAKLVSLPRAATTNQKIGFDIDPSGRWLVSGGSTGRPRMWDLKKSFLSGGDSKEQSVEAWRAGVGGVRPFSDAVSAATFHPSLPLVAFGTGQRHFSRSSASNSKEEQEAFFADAWAPAPEGANEVSLWRLQ
jgi:WD40 repeat protein